MKNITPQPLSKSAKPSPERGLQTVPKSTSPAGGKVTDEALARDIRKQFAKVKKAELTWLAFGFKLLWIKNCHVKHGQFTPWLEKHVPEMGYKAVATYMQCAAGVLEVLQRELDEALPLANQGQFLLCAPRSLSDPAKILREEILKVVNNRTKYQFLTAYKQGQLFGDELRPKVGRMPGEGGKHKLTYSEKEALAKKCAEKDAAEVCTILNALGSSFMFCEAPTLALLEATLERHVRAIRAWAKQPRDTKQPELIQALFTTPLTAPLTLARPAPAGPGEV